MEGVLSVARVSPRAAPVTALPRAGRAPSPVRRPVAAPSMLRVSAAPATRASAAPLPALGLPAPGGEHTGREGGAVRGVEVADRRVEAGAVDQAGGEHGRAAALPGLGPEA